MDLKKTPWFYWVVFAGLLLLLLYFVSSNSSSDIKVEDLNGIWVGCYTINDPRTPRASVLKLNKDQSYQRESIEYAAIDGQWALKKQILTFDTIDFEIKTMQGDSMVLEFQSRSVFKKSISASIKETKQQIENKLENTSWQFKNPEGEDVFLHFSHDKIYRYTKAEKDLSIYCWHVIKFDDLAFLYNTGTKRGCNKYPSRLKQITAIDKETLAFQHFNETLRGKEIFKKIPYKASKIEDLNAINIVQECTSYGRYSCGTIMIVNEDPALVVPTYFKKYKRPENTEDQSGFISLKFEINCEGQLSRFSEEGMDTDYQTFKFDDRIVNQLIDITKGIENWTGYQYKGKYRDCKKVMIFKLKNGNLVDLSP